MRTRNGIMWRWVANSQNRIFRGERISWPSATCWRVSNRTKTNGGLSPNVGQSGLPTTVLLMKQRWNFVGKRYPVLLCYSRTLRVLLSCLGLHSSRHREPFIRSWRVYFLGNDGAQHSILPRSPSNAADPIVDTGGLLAPAAAILRLRAAIALPVLSVLIFLGIFYTRLREK